MKASFSDFTVKYKGKVFIIYSLDGEIGNEDVTRDIKTEIKRLQKI
jgi:hypothetical protein